ncbi:hypothetical protein [Lysinibacter sp. HNR]|uniref:hypothetical protein n=1 Tax=Lysinibacter sp. HNR TaxID=3031408 RepID=UPI002435643F|nr:hypothetical protein [Lysinibacter sp. HNR]WGD36709.1 hypothetical protein FrondiHNR_09600 [Lysinibacter sp. HNR]
MPRLPRVKSRQLILIPALIAALSLSACSVVALPNSTDERDDRGGTTMEGETDVFDLREGDCFNDNNAPLSEDSDSIDDTITSAGYYDSNEDDEVTSVYTVPCEQLHDYEVYKNIILEGSRYPGDDEIDTQADEACWAEFESFVEFPYADSEFWYTYYTPTAEGWRILQDRTISCIIFADEPTTGTLAGAAR